MNPKAHQTDKANKAPKAIQVPETSKANETAKVPETNKVPGPSKVYKINKPRIIQWAACFLVLAVFLLTPACDGAPEAPYYDTDISPELEKEAAAEDWAFQEDYNVIVVGTDPEGISAAVASARNGMKTLLIDERERIGGLLTKGKLNTLDMNHGPDGELLTRGIFQEFYDQLECTSFNTETAERVFNEMVEAEDNLELKTSTQVLGPVLEGDKVVGLKTLQDGETVNYAAQRMIDATIDADMAVLGGAPYSIGLEDISLEGKYQVATLVFELENVDWDTAKEHLQDDGNPNTGADERSLWGFYHEMVEYESEDPTIMVRGLNVGRQEGDRVLINAVHILDVNPLDAASVADGKQRAQEELPGIVAHINEYIPGFSQAELSGTADELYLREGRHIQGEYTLTINDARENRDFWDKVAFGSYPVDIQRTSRNRAGYVIANPAQYSIPFRSLVPQDVENLVVVGKAASFDSQAHGSARVVPIGMATGQAAGAASRLSLEEDVTFRELSKDEALIAELQERLKHQGAYLDDFDHGFAGEGRWTLDGIRFMLRWGRLIGGYQNEFGFDEEISFDRFVTTFGITVEKYFNLDDFEMKRDFDQGEASMTREDAAKLLLGLIIDEGEDCGAGDSGQECFARAVDMGAFSGRTEENLEPGANLAKDEAYVLMQEFIKFMDETGRMERQPSPAGSPFIEREAEGETYIHVERLRDDLGAHLFKDQSERAFILQAGVETGENGLHLRFPVESEVMHINGREVELAQPTTNFLGRHYIHLESLKEELPEEAANLLEIEEAVTVEP